MRQIKKEERQRRLVFWVVASAFALAAHAAAFLFLKPGFDDSGRAEADMSFVTLPSVSGHEGYGDLLRQQAYLFDSAPLFLTTRWNAASSPSVTVMGRRPAAELFDSFSARLSFGEGDYGLGAISTNKPRTPLQSLSAFPDGAHTSFGLAEVRAPGLEQRFAVLEVFKLSGEAVSYETVPEIGAPAAGGQLWRPVEFMMQVTAVGVVGEAVLIRGSGLPAVDLFLRDAIRRLPAERMLDPGYYRVIAGP